MKDPRGLVTGLPRLVCRSDHHPSTGHPAYRLDIMGDTATVGPADGQVDCILSVDPVAFLRVGYGRANPLTAALTGKVVAFGRKPWLGLTFGSLLAAP